MGACVDVIDKHLKKAPETPEEAVRLLHDAFDDFDMGINISSAPQTMEEHTAKCCWLLPLNLSDPFDLIAAMDAIDGTDKEDVYGYLEAAESEYLDHPEDIPDWEETLFPWSYQLTENDPPRDSAEKYIESISDKFFRDGDDILFCKEG